MAGTYHERPELRLKLPGSHVCAIIAFMADLWSRVSQGAHVGFNAATNGAGQQAVSRWVK